MIRRLLPAGFCACLALTVQAGELRIPGVSPDAPQPLALPPCVLTGTADSCVRTLACIGRNGLYFDGQARGFNSGTLAGQRSDGVPCVGTWAYTVLGSATARLECADGLTGRVIYYAEDSSTGTGIARGVDSKGRAIKAWTGAHVLKYLGETGVAAAKLPCGEVPIPIS